MAEKKHFACVTADSAYAGKLQDTVLKAGGTWRRLNADSEIGKGQVPSLLMVDVTDPDAIEIIEAVRSSEAWKDVHILAFGHHAHVHLLDGSRAAGANEVIARARFKREFSERVQDLIKPPATATES